MTDLNGAHEPSMDEILASIRKIIADDTTAAPPSASAAQAASSREQDMRTAFPRATSTEAPTSLSARLNDMFGSGSAQPAQPVRPGVFARTAVDHDLDDLLDDEPVAPASSSRAGAPVASEKTASGPISSGSSLGDVRPSPVVPDTTRRPLPMGFAPGAPGASRPDPVKEAAKPAPVVIAAEPATSAAKPQAPYIPSPRIDFGATPAKPAAAVQAAAPVAAAPVTASTPAAAPTAKPQPAQAPLVPAPKIDFSKIIPAQAMTEPKPISDPVPTVAKASEELPSATIAAAPVVVAEEPVPAGPVVLAAMPAPAKPNVEATVSPVKAAEPVVAAPSRPVPAVSPVHIPGPVSAYPAPSSADAAAQVPTVSPMAALAIGLDTTARKPAAPAAVGASAPDPVASALGALAAGLAASAKPPTPEIVVPPADLGKPTVRQVAATPPEPAILVPTTAVSMIPASDGSREAAAHLDDTAAELLRPMLRQWLDSNMPRIVEKALKLELAENPPVAPTVEPKA